ncbi:MAG: hypothetical protein HZB38_14865 [Planctomycetes bacterium]|nr:hypothetical protein [Planctomycetota bacterium]
MPAPVWADWSDDALLGLRFCDLRVGLFATPLADRVVRLYVELARRHLRARPHVWLSHEWFAPDGVPGFAAPFYLAHPRLMELERSQMLEVEGGSPQSCMQILRHEAGHAIDHAYRLYRRADYRRIFGRCRPYPDWYRPRPDSRRFVLHLDSWYAQSHPAEDFAETFAVWLTPESDWRRRYRNWPAARKLEYVDWLMNEIAGSPPAVRSRARLEPLSALRTTLREHYQRRRARYANDVPVVYDADLQRLFEACGGRGRTAAAFLRRAQPELRELVARWTGQPAYTIDQVLREMAVRCRRLGLHATRSARRMTQDAAVLVTVHTLNFLRGRRRRVAI